MAGDEPNPLDYEKREPRDYSYLVRLMIFGFLAAVLGSAIVHTFLPSRNSGTGDGAVGKCQSNLHEIGLGIQLYCDTHKGTYPDSFQSLMLDEPLSPEAFVCPASNDSPCTAPTTQEQAAELSAEGHLSYVYIGKGLIAKTVVANQVIAYEPLANHTDRIHVLLGDGHVEFVNLNRATKIIADAKSGVSPVILPP